MIYAVAVLSGLGGLLVELVLVRRYGLLLGNTSEASALVIGTYLLGLGVGGLAVSAVLRRRSRPLTTAAGLYAAVAVSALALDALLQAVPPLPVGAGLVLLLLTPGVPTLLMGMAFPLVFTALGDAPTRWRVGGLVGANLGGSLVATAFGGNLLIPELGLQVTQDLASAAYLGAAGLLTVAPARRTEASAVRPGRTGGARPALGPLAVLAALSGALVVGLQVLLLRRLPFFLEGFQPTLSGVLAAVLLGLTLGSALGTPLLHRWFGARAPSAALLLAVGAMALGLHEHLAAPLARFPIGSELAMHARIWLCAFVSSGLPCFFLGAVIPLCVVRFDEPEARSALTGRLFFWQGLGSVGGSLLVGELLPALWPSAFFVVTPLALGLGCVWLMARQLRAAVVAGASVALVAAALAGVSGPGRLLAPRPPLERPGSPLALRPVDHRTDSTVTASVAYDPRTHSMVLFTNEFRAAETGPFADYMQLLGHLPFLLRDELENVAVIAFGTGTTAEAVTLWPEPSEIHLVEISRAVLDLAGHFAGDGPLPAPRTPRFLEDPRSSVHVTDGRRFLARREAGSLDLVTMEPLLPYSPGTVYLYSREFYALASRALTPRGLLVQWVPTHAVPPDYYDSLLATFARSFAHHSVWFLDGATILVGSHQPHLGDAEGLARRLEAAPEPARLGLHEARIAGLDDLRAALVGEGLAAVLGEAPDVSDDRPFLERVGIWKYDGSHRFFYRPNFSVLEQLARTGRAGALGGENLRRMRSHRIRGYRALRDASRGWAPRASVERAVDELAAARAVLPWSVVLHHEETLALRAARQLDFVARRGRGMGGLVSSQLARDAGWPMGHAALALRRVAGEAVVPADEAAARALAIAPHFFESAPDFLAYLAPEAPAPSPLEGIGVLPSGRVLAEWVTGDDPRAVALRGAYRVRSAEALLEVLQQRPLRPDEQRSLVPLLDPALLLRASEAVAARGGSQEEEVRPLWREDLPLPRALAELRRF